MKLSIHFWILVTACFIVLMIIAEDWDIKQRNECNAKWWRYYYSQEHYSTVCEKETRIFIPLSK